MQDGSFQFAVVFFPSYGRLWFYRCCLCLVQHCSNMSPKIKKKLDLAALFIPLPWIAIEAGWFVAEYGRQPWAVGILPTHVAASTLAVGELWVTPPLALYSVFLVVEVYLMLKYTRQGLAV